MLELRDLARRYGDVVALDGISFEVEPGKLFGFVGPNGAGWGRRRPSRSPAAR